MNVRHVHSKTPVEPPATPVAAPGAVAARVEAPPALPRAVTVPTQMPAVFAWLFFIPGALFIAIDVVRLQMSGVAVLGVAFLSLWLWLIGGFEKKFWVTDIDDDHPEALGSLDLRERGH